MKCNNCGNEHDGTFGSGRFCSIKCSRSFSTKAKRTEINESLRRIPTEKICPVCESLFRSNRNKTCSQKCSYELSKISNTGIQHKHIEDTSKMGGLRERGGRAKQLPYTNWLGFRMSLNKDEIQIAKILDEKKCNWNRNTKGFPYVTEDGKHRKFYPDFVVNENEYYEYKGWVTPQMEWKMLNAIETNAIETNAINLHIIVGRDPRYQRFGMTINDFEHNLS